MHRDDSTMEQKLIGIQLVDEVTKVASSPEQLMQHIKED